MDGLTMESRDRAPRPRKPLDGGDGGEEDSGPRRPKVERPNTDDLLRRMRTTLTRAAAPATPRASPSNAARSASLSHMRSSASRYSRRVRTRCTSARPRARAGSVLNSICFRIESCQENRRERESAQRE